MWNRIWAIWDWVIVDLQVLPLLRILDNSILALFSALSVLGKWLKEFQLPPRIRSAWRNLKARLESFAAEKPVHLVFWVLLGAVCFVISLSSWFYDYNSEFWQNILVEAHGMLFDLFVISGFLFWLQRLGERQLTIKRYREEIRDFLDWQSEEAMHRIVGNIKRLNREGIGDIFLYKAYLSEASLYAANLRGADLERASLKEAFLNGANLERASLVEADLYRAGLLEANLTEAFLNGANLERANLERASLKEANLNRANLMGADLSEAKNLTLEQVQSARTDETTKLPSYLTEQAAPPAEP